MKLIKMSAAAVFVVALVAGASPASATSVETLRDTMTAISDDMDEISVTAGAMDTASLADACNALYLDAARALRFKRPSVLPRSAWRHLRSGFRLLSYGGVTCQAGALELDASTIRQATRLMEQGTAKIVLATDEMEAAT